MSHKTKREEDRKATSLADLEDGMSVLGEGLQVRHVHVAYRRLKRPKQFNTVH